MCGPRAGGPADVLQQAAQRRRRAVHQRIFGRHSSQAGTRRPASACKAAIQLHSAKLTRSRCAVEVHRALHAAKTSAPSSATTDATLLAADRPSRRRHSCIAGSLSMTHVNASKCIKVIFARASSRLARWSRVDTFACAAVTHGGLSRCSAARMRSRSGSGTEAQV